MLKGKFYPKYPDFEREREENRLKKLQNRMRKMEDPMEDVWRPHW